MLSRTQAPEAGADAGEGAGVTGDSPPACTTATLSLDGRTRVATPMRGALCFSSESARALGFRTATARPFQTS